MASSTKTQTNGSTQRTLSKEVKFSGVGLHTGIGANMKMKPAPLGSGIRFVRTDIAIDADIPVNAQHLAFLDRRTTLRNGEAEIQTVEHLLAGFAAYGIDNITCEIDGPEVPGGDGSALEFCKIIEKAGLTDQGQPRDVFVLDTVLWAGDGEASIVALPDPEGLRIEYHLDYGKESPFPQQRASALVGNNTLFMEGVIPARTFCLLEEAQALQKLGLGKGATTKNTLVVGPDGVLDNEYRFPNELACHKLLDVAGDLSILGKPIRARILAHKTGHRHNAMLVRRIQARIDLLEKHGKSNPCANVEESGITGVDSIWLDPSGDKAEGLIHISATLDVFRGHFPSVPVLPGVFQLQLMAEVAATLARENEEPLQLTACRRVKFKRRVEPGCRLIIRAERIKDDGRVRVTSMTTALDETSEAIFKFQEKGA